MKIITFKVKVITPTLMGGGYSQNDGIRPAEIKGIMRYWFRAVAGSIIGNDIKALKELESLVFGSQERKSPFRIITIADDLNFLDETDFFFPKMNGVVYLGIGNVLFKYIRNKGFVFNTQERINIIKPDSTFTIKFLFRRTLKPEIKRLIALSFYLATALGGFGLRARRGFGSWQIIKSPVKIESFDFEKYEKNKIYEAIRLAQNYIKNLTKINPSLEGLPSVPILKDKYYDFSQVHTSFNNWKNLFNELGALYRGYRVNPDNPVKDDFQKKHTKDYDDILDFINRKEENIKLRNPVFGLNIQYSSSDRKFKASVELRSKKNGKWETLRRASPMFISVKEINNKLSVNFLVFYSKFKPDNAGIFLKSNKLKKPESVSAFGYKITDKFIKWASKELEVKNDK